MNHSIMRAQVIDLLEIAGLDRTGWSRNRNADYIADGEHVWRHWIDYALTFIARAPGGALLGFVVAFPTIKQRHYYLHKLLIADGRRGEGLGGALLDPLCQILDRNKLSIELSSDTNNGPMHSLVTRYGFVEDRLEKGYYRENEDRLIFIRQPQS